MAQVAMPSVDVLREGFPEAARDSAVNLGNIASSDHLDEAQIWGVALSSAYYLGEPRLLEALLNDYRVASPSASILEDAQAAATLMAMNTVYYRFRHLVGQESYGRKPARLRMHAMVKPKTSKANFELNSLALAALAGCEVCIQAHEASVQQHGLTEEHVHDAVRIAAILNGAAVALRL